MGKLVDLTGKRFTKLLVIKRVANDKSGNPHWLCKCDCGNYKVIQGGNLRSGHTKSCGCLQKERVQTHGMSTIPEYQVYYAMISRCYNSNNQAYKYYGGRGITVCDRWLSSFISFLNDMGKKPGLLYTIERINNDGNYTSDNCKWATAKEQAGNKRLNSRCYKFKAISPIGRVYTSKNQHEFARQFNLSCRLVNACLKNRYKTHKGWTFERVG